MGFINKGKSITHSIFRLQSGVSVICGFYCFAFIEYMIAVKTLLDYTNLFSRNDYQQNDMLIYKYFKTNMGKENVIPDCRLKNR